MVERLRRAAGYGPAPWLNKRQVQAALSLLSVWAVGTMTYGLWSAATVHQPSPDQIDSFLASLLMPGLVLPAILLACLGSRLAWALIVAFEALDFLNNLDSLDGVVFHLALAVLVTLVAVVVWRFRRAVPPVAPPRVAAWKRINLFVVVVAALVAFAAFSGTAGYAAHHGNLPQLTPAVSMLVSAIAWTGSVLLAVSLWKRLPFLLWAFAPAIFIIGFGFMSVACPGCTWASH